MAEFNSDQEDANSDYDGLNAPSAADLQVDPNLLDEYKVAGTMTANNANAAQENGNAFNGVSSNSNDLAAQNAALAQLQNTASSGGMNASDVANLNQVKQEQNSNNAAQQAAILDQAQQRGQGGSGVSLAAQLGAQQSGANAAANADQSVASNAANRALSAMQGAGQMGSQMEAQQFGEQAQKAQAQNAINAMNTQNQQQSNMFNANAANSAEAMNLNNAQNVSNANVGNYNQGLYYNAQAPQTSFQDQLGADSAEAGTNLGQQGTTNALTAQEFNEIMQEIGMGGKLVGNIAGGIAGAARGGKVVNSYANDTVPTMLSPGEVVVPKSVVNKPANKIGKFVKTTGTIPERFDHSKFISDMVGKRIAKGKLYADEGGMVPDLSLGGGDFQLNSSPADMNTNFQLTEPVLGQSKGETEADEKPKDDNDSKKFDWKKALEKLNKDKDDVKLTSPNIANVNIPQMAAAEAKMPQGIIAQSGFNPQQGMAFTPVQPTQKAARGGRVQWAADGGEVAPMQLQQPQLGQSLPQPLQPVQPSPGAKLPPGMTPPDPAKYQALQQAGESLQNKSAQAQKEYEAMLAAHPMPQRQEVPKPEMWRTILGSIGNGLSAMGGGQQTYNPLAIQKAKQEENQRQYENAVGERSQAIKDYLTAKGLVKDANEDAMKAKRFGWEEQMAPVQLQKEQQGVKKGEFELGEENRKQGLEKQLDDKNSSVSQSSRELAKRLGIPINGNETAAELQSNPLIGHAIAAFTSRENAKEATSRALIAAGGRANAVNNQAENQAAAEVDKKTGDLEKRINILEPSINSIEDWKKEHGSLDKANNTEIAQMLMPMVAGETGRFSIQALNDIIPHTFEGNAKAWLQSLSSNPQGTGQGELVQRILDQGKRQLHEYHNQYNKLEDEVRKNRGLKPREREEPAQQPSETANSNEVKRVTADGKTAVFDANTKKFLRYE